jgi:hypothetical protein
VVTWFVHSLEKQCDGGSRLVGPFDTQDAAEDWADKYLPQQTIWYVEDCLRPADAEAELRSR